MDAPRNTSAIRFNRLLPYWAVLQTDIRQTARSWVYRLWVMMLVLCAAGHIVFRLGAARMAGDFQAASVQTGDLLRLLVIGSLSLISLIAVSAISSERGTVADSILSRGISRYQYFLAKLHARLLVILGTFSLIGSVVLLSHTLAFHHEVTGGTTNLTIDGSLIGLLVLAAGLAVVVSCGVVIGGVTNSTVTGITIFWIVIFGGLFLLSQMPRSYATPDMMMEKLRSILSGGYNTAEVSQYVLGTLIVSLIAGAIGLVWFGRRDI
ncbi:MAG: ABC transporter permease [Gemmataceae bacterium]